MVSDDASDEPVQLPRPEEVEPIPLLVASDGLEGHLNGANAASAIPKVLPATSGDAKPPLVTHPFLHRVSRRTLVPLPAEARPAIDAFRRLTGRVASARASAPAQTPSDGQHASVEVERDDSIATICGKLDSTRLTRVAIIVARGNAELSRPIGMRLLMRHADLTGKDIIVVARGHSVRQRARAEGQPVARNDRSLRFDAQNKESLQLGGLDLPLPDRSVMLTAAALGTFAILGFAVVFWYLPVANINLLVQSAPVNDEQLLTLDEQANHLNSSGLLVPATRNEISVTRTVYIPTTGSPGPDSGAGQGAAKTTVADGDIKSAQDLATVAIRDQGAADLAIKFGSAETLFPTTAQVHVVSVEPREHAGEAVDFLQVTYRGSASMLAARTADLQQIFTDRLREKVGSDRQLIDGSLVLSTIKAGTFDADAQKLPVQMRADASSAVSLNARQMQVTLRGRSRQDAVLAIDRQVGAIRSADIHLTPGWAPWLPRIASHIHLRLHPAGAE